jgi:hypothetical protein
MPALAAWSLAGIRAAAGDADQRRKFFALEGATAHRNLADGGQDVLFADVERRLKAYMVALWRRHPPFRALADGALDQRRRASFDGGILRLPDVFRGFPAAEARRLFLAAVAHVGAHFEFSTVRFPVGSLKPVQVALISLIEDARIEQLAIRRFPGLRRLWLPFHTATAQGAISAPALMARLAHALIDPGHVDDNGWVTKGRMMMADAADRIDDPAISRSIGGLLGNDLGQMRAQFNAKTYVVEPAYRDDNQGLWDFGMSSAAPEDEIFIESARIERHDDPAGETDRATRHDELHDGRAERAALVAPEEEIGVPVARYGEWDYLIGRNRADWATIVDYPASEGRAARIDELLAQRPDLVNRVTGLIRSAKVSRPIRLRRQAEGDRLDLDACIAAAVDRRLSGFPDPKAASSAVFVISRCSCCSTRRNRPTISSRTPAGPFSTSSAKRRRSWRTAWPNSATPLPFMPSVRTRVPTCITTGSKNLAGPTTRRRRRVSPASPGASRRAWARPCAMPAASCRWRRPIAGSS